MPLRGSFRETHEVGIRLSPRDLNEIDKLELSITSATNQSTKKNEKVTIQGNVRFSDVLWTTRTKLCNDFTSAFPVKRVWAVIVHKLSAVSLIWGHLKKTNNYSEVPEEVVTTYKNLFSMSWSLIFRIKSINFAPKIIPACRVSIRENILQKIDLS